LSSVHLVCVRQSRWPRTPWTGPVALADYAASQDAHIVFLPAQRPETDELSTLLNEAPDGTEPGRSKIEVHSVGDAG
jgi:hypothetical protein